MNTGVIISLVGIIIALSLLVVMVMKGINIFIIAIVCSSLVAITGSLNVYDALKVDYMTGFVGFLQANFFIFLTGTLMGKIMEITGGAKSIAKMIVRWIGKDKALLSIPIACGILAYGGVSVFVVSFAVFPIALEIFKEADLPRRFIPAALTFGCSTFCYGCTRGTTNSEYCSSINIRDRYYGWSSKWFYIMCSNVYSWKYHFVQNGFKRKSQWWSFYST